MEIITKVGEYKKQKNVPIFQAERWAEILKTRGEWASENNVSVDFIEKIYRLIHDESLKLQTKIYHKGE